MAQRRPSRKNGDLVLPVEGGPEVRFNKPVVYQMVDGVRRPVDGSFAIAAVNHQQQVSFQLGAYDTAANWSSTELLFLAYRHGQLLKLRQSAWRSMRRGKSSHRPKPAT